MTPQTALAMFTTLTLMVIIPGPGVMGVISHSLSYGFRPTLRMITGMLLGDLIYLSLAILGMSAMAHYLSGLFLLVKLAGAAYLIWMGVRLWRKKYDHDPDVPVQARSSLWKTFVSGLFLTLGNPKVMLFYVGLLPNFIDLKQVHLPDMAAAMAIVSSVVFTILTVYAWFAARAGRLFKHRRARKIMDRISGTVLIGTGAAVAIRH